MSLNRPLTLADAIDNVCEFVAGVINEAAGFETQQPINTRSVKLCEQIDALADCHSDYKPLLLTLTLGYSQLENIEINLAFSKNLLKLFQLVKHNKQLLEENDQYCSLFLAILYCLTMHTANDYKLCRDNICVAGSQEAMSGIVRVVNAANKFNYKIYTMAQWIRMSYLYSVTIAQSATGSEVRSQDAIKTYMDREGYEKLRKVLRNETRSLLVEDKRYQLCLNYLLDVYNARVVWVQDSHIRGHYNKSKQALSPTIAVTATARVQEEIKGLEKSGLFEFLKSLDNETIMIDPMMAPVNNRDFFQSFFLLNKLDDDFSLLKVLYREVAELLSELHTSYNAVSRYLENEFSIYQLSIQNADWEKIRKLKEEQLKIMLLRNQFLGENLHATLIRTLTDELKYMDMMLEKHHQSYEAIAQTLAAEQLRRPVIVKKKKVVVFDVEPAVSSKKKKTNKTVHINQIKSPEPEPIENMFYRKIRQRQFVEAEADSMQWLEEAKQENDAGSIACAYSQLAELYRFWSLSLMDDDCKQKQLLAEKCYQLADTAIDQAVTQLGRAQSVDLLRLQEFNRQFLVTALTPPPMPALVESIVTVKRALVAAPVKQMQEMPKTIRLPKFVMTIAEKLRAQKINGKPCRVYVVGGAVRDNLLGKESVDDFDLVTDASVQTVVKLFNLEGKLVGNNYPVFLIPGQQPVQISWICTDKQSSQPVFVKINDGNTVVLTPTDNLYEDAERRDFTVNAFYYDMFAHKVLHLPQALIDLQHRRLVFIKPTDSAIACDPSLIFRAARFCAKIKLDMSPIDLQCLHDNSALIMRLSKGRYRFEVNKTMAVLEKERLYSILDKIGILNKFFETNPEDTEAKKSSPYLSAAKSQSRFFKNKTTLTPQTPVMFNGLRL